MVSQGELPESVHGADVYMQLGTSDQQRVKLKQLLIIFLIFLFVGEIDSSR